MILAHVFFCNVFLWCISEGHNFHIKHRWTSNCRGACVSGKLISNLWNFQLSNGNTLKSIIQKSSSSGCLLISILLSVHSSVISVGFMVTCAFFSSWGQDWWCVVHCSPPDHQQQETVPWVGGAPVWFHHGWQPPPQAGKGSGIEVLKIRMWHLANQMTEKLQGPSIRGHLRKTVQFLHQ